MKIFRDNAEQPVFGLLERISIIAMVVVATLFTLS